MRKSLIAFVAAGSVAVVAAAAPTAAQARWRGYYGYSYGYPTYYRYGYYPRRYYWRHYAVW